MGARTWREAALGRGALVLLAAALAAGCTGRTRPALSLPDPATIDLTEVASRSAVQDRTKGCVSCHVGQTEPHPLPADPSKGGRFEHVIGCADCHGGDGTVMAPAGEVIGSPAYDAAKKQAHVAPKFPKRWETSRNPEHTATLLQHESWEFVRFVNPGDLRVAQQTCGTTGCHGGVNQDGTAREPFEDHVLRVQKSMMTHGAMLWGAALYNNGAYLEKTPRFGESYAPDGSPQRIYTVPAPTPEETARDGVLPFLDPLPRFEVGQPSNVLRIFERGARRPQLIGNPLPGVQGFGLEEEHGRPANRLSNRGFGTLNRTDPVWLNLQRTRLLDPTLNQLGTNDHPGDFRSSGCTACHMVYANDRDPLTELRQGKDSPANHSGPFAKYGNQGKSFQSDPTIPRDEEGHPIQHLLTRQIPSSQCIVCHMHPGTLVSNTYLGYTWWDLETDGKHFWPGPENDYAWKDPEGKPDPTKQIYPSYEDFMVATNHNPEGSTPKGLWNWREFLDQTGSKEFNQKLKKMQVGDFHGHGFIFRAVWKKDLKGNLLDDEGGVVAADDPDKWKKAVHLKDIHLERGMHCVDCHFTVDNHGNAKLYGEPRAATAIMCIDCHGSATKYTELVTTGKSGGQDLSLSMTPFGKRFRWVGPEKSPTLIQQSQVVPDLTWEVPQTLDSLDPDHETYNEKSAFAKTVRFEVVENGERKVVWGDLPEGSDKLSAHRDDNMACYSCHTSWMASCFGCHLPMKANERREALHNEGQIQRNWTSYSFQTLRDDVFMLGVDGSITGAKVIPVRSACAVMVGSQNQNREWVYAQQQTISAEGFSGTAFSPHFPHTVRTTETKGCTDCHLSEDGDNNALMATLLMQGTNVANFLGRYIYVASGDGGFDAVVVSERDEPQAVYGSSLHKLAWPDQWKAHQDRGKALSEAYHHAANTVLGVEVPFGSEEVHSLQMRGEYLYTANGTGGLKVYDVAQIDQKGFATRIVTAPVSPLGQRFYVDTKNATSVKAPSTQGVDPVRAQRPENEEQKPHLLYGFLYVTDLEEGLILVLAATLLEGDPDNNFLERNVTFNPDGILKGAVNCHVAGEHVYVLCDAGLVVVSVANPLEPKVAAVLSEGIVKPKAIEVQFRYGFLCDAEGMKVIDLTQPATPRLVKEATVPLASAHNLYLSRAYAYVAAGADGLVIVDVSKPEAPVVAQRFTADGQMNDCRDVKIGMTNASIFAYVADGKNGLRVVEIASPERTPGVSGFHPTPTPELIATYPTRGAATAISQGIARDRAVDESGHQTAVFGRKGSRPFTKEEMERFYMHPDGSVWTVGAEPHGEKRAFQRPARPAAGEEARK